MDLAEWRRYRSESFTNTEDIHLKADIALQLTRIADALKDLLPLLNLKKGE